MKKTLVLGASPNPTRYSYAAVKQLARYGHEVVAVGNREGIIDGISIQKGQPNINQLDTVTLYLSDENQKQYYDYILHLNPKRIIFNPGAENPELARLAKEKGIEILPACTLVMLSVGNY
ncbi:MAG: CoA-binding protein [Saprospiraceae bacterium]|nr:CoA-binding protein [Saprospiraceae bacterium]